MTTLNIFERLRHKLEADGDCISAVGVDLGTTKSCVALAAYDADAHETDCECVPFPEPGIPGAPIAVPSVVAVKNGEVAIGHAARRLIGRKGYTPLRNVFRESKNDIGLRYRYWKAPEGFQSATDIASHLLRYLLVPLAEELTNENVPLVITVPASFHGAQRNATLEAAHSLIDDPQVTLLDEPYAAFLDLLFQQPEVLNQLPDSANILVFDFGGGTCDVAMFSLIAGKDGLAPRLHATSRYHRIGGGDIDRAIVHDHLIPLLLKNHHLKPTHFDWRIKRYVLEPQLLPLAERLKIALCRCVLDQEKIDGKEKQDSNVVAAGEYEIHVDDATMLFLESPSLNSAQFQTILQPFLDPEPQPDGLQDDYVVRGSIFSPILQTLIRARVEASEIDAVIVAGSSSLIPEVQQALKNYFSEAQLLTWSDATELQGAIARGAALQALSIAALGEPLIEPVCSGDIGIQTRQGFLPLVQAGSSLPQTNQAPIVLHAPESSLDLALDIAVEILADGNRLLGRSLWSLPAPVHAGEALHLHWSLDINQCLSLELHRAGQSTTDPFQQRFDAPVAHLDLGQVVRCRMLEREEAIRNNAVAKEDLGNAYTEIARDHASLGEHERALHFVALAMQRDGSTSYLLNLLGNYRSALGDTQGAEASYRQANSCTSQFNLALLQFRNGNARESVETLDNLLERDQSRPSRILKAKALEKLGNTAEARLLYQDALHGQLNLHDKDEWELGWLGDAAQKLNAEDTRKAINAELARLRERTHSSQRQGQLPDQAVARS